MIEYFFICLLKLQMPYNLQKIYDVARHVHIQDFSAGISESMLNLLARLDEVQKDLCTTPGVGVHIYVKVFLMAYIFQIT